MSSNWRRISALQALVAGSPIPQPVRAQVNQEFAEVYNTRRIRKVPRRLLLEVLHSTRALDTALASYIVEAGGPQPVSLGAALYHLVSPGIHSNRLSPQSRQHYQAAIVDSRNDYMHQAGKFPSAPSEISALLTEMHSCLTDALSLW